MPSNSYEKMRKYSEARWTNYTWYIIHTICLYAYLKPKEYQENVDRYKKFFILLQEELPCPECSDHCYQHLRENRIDEKTDMHVWATNFHNSVNERLNKKKFSPSETKKFYMEKDGSDWNLVIDWTFYYYMVKIYANVAYTNKMIEHFCELLEALRKVIPDKDVRQDLPRLKDSTDENTYIRKYLAVLKKLMPSKQLKIGFGQD